jgi:hypothetical protein
MHIEDVRSPLPLAVLAVAAACGGATLDASQPDASSHEGSVGCVPNQSIACVGPGGCAGGQACNADGTAYSPCDCGSADDAGGGDATTGDAATDGAFTGGPCVKPKGPTVGIFNLLTPQNPWSDPSTGLAGSLFLDPPSAGSFQTGYAGLQVKYSQEELASGQFIGDPSFGVYFSTCVDASAFKGLSYQFFLNAPAPAGATGVLRVLTVSTTPIPYGTCVPVNAGDCTAAYVEPFSNNFVSNTPYTITWDLLSGGSPAEPGITAATEIVGLAWQVDEFEGPPAQQVSLDVIVNAVAFVPVSPGGTDAEASE